MIERGLRFAVVVASNNARASIEACLATLTAQAADENVEIVVVDNSTDGTREIIQRQFPRLRLVVEPPSRWIPQLWATGIRLTKAEIVAITTAHCVPDACWLAAMRRAHTVSTGSGPSASAVGGAIENTLTAGVVTWAVYFCRYSRFMLPFPEGDAEEIAGDNASYRRADIDRCRHAWRDGFWETAVHAELRKMGRRLRLVPEIVIRHHESFSCRGFMRQRFFHGRQFGEERASRVAAAQRVLYLLLSPAIPLVVLLRITRRALSKRRHGREFVRSLPVLLLFVFAWSLGEFTGYARGSR